jgi:type II secretion system protein G
MNKKKGFTLIELLVVIAIISLLASIVIASLNTARSKARDTQRVAEMRSLQTAFEMYYDDFGVYPLYGEGTPDETYQAWGADAWPYWHTILPSKYITGIPYDPLNVDLVMCETTPDCHIYRYCVSPDRQHYVFAVNLENSPKNPGSVVDINSPDNPCGQGNPVIGGPNPYQVYK